MGKRNLVHLFDADLKYRGQDQAKDAVTSPDGKVGKYIGSGDGVVNGEKIEGRIRWDLYEDIDGGTCLTNMAGRIETEDGATIHFDARGHGKIVNPDNPDDWVMVYGVKFDSQDSRFAWLNVTLGVWEGEFSMKSYEHHYSIYGHKNS